MGQKLGRVELLPTVEPFTNLPRRAILNIWQVFNNVSDGFGVGIDEIREICSDLKDELNISRLSMDEKSSSLFNIFDTDKNGLIDALEFFSTITTLSGMKKWEIIEFILTIYDFDGTGTLSMDEVVLALKSASIGLCKLVKEEITVTKDSSVAKEELIELIVSYIFHSHLSTEITDDTRISTKILCSLINAHPDISTWFNFFSAPSQTGLQLCKLSDEDKDFQTENVVVAQTPAVSLAIDWNVRSQSGIQLIDAMQNPWVSVVAMITPIAYANKDTKSEAPNVSIHPEWIYGYQSERTKNTVHYNYQGDALYTISKYAVLYSFRNNNQKIFTGHSNEITCLKMHPKKQLVASGEAGSHPKVIVWHSSTHKILFSNQDFHRDGVVHVAFSNDGKLLISVGNDSMQTIRVCRWEDNELLFNSPVASGKCLGCTILSGNTVVVAGDSYIYFWRKSLQGYIRRSGIFSRYTPLQPITVVEPVHGTENLVCGTALGQLMLWVDINCVRTVKAHNGTINSIYSCAHGLLSGGKDRRIRMWSANLEPSVTFDISYFGSNPVIRSLCMSEDGTSIIFGTRGASVYEISAIDGSDLRGGPIAMGHHFGRINCLTVHPSKFEFATVGQDRTLRVYDMNTKAQLKLANFDGEVSAVTYSPIGDIIAVGFGGTSITGNNKNGSFVILNEEDLVVNHESRDSKSAVTLLAFSNEGETFAVGYEDGSILLYSVQDDYQLIAKCVRHTGSIIAIDFSLDGEWIRSNSSTKELCFFNSDDGSFLSNSNSMRDVQWATNTCIYSWHTRAIHDSPYPAETIVSAHAPNVTKPTSTGEDGSQENLPPQLPEYVASGSNIGYISLYPFPCATKAKMLTESHRYPAHVDTILSLRFSFDTKRLISIGAKDRCIIQWSCFASDNDNATSANSQTEEKESEEHAMEARSGDALAEEFMPDSCDIPVGKLNSSVQEMTKLKSSIENDVWISALVDPTVLPKQNKSVPDMSLMLDYVYGYESQRMRNNVRYTATGDIAYTVSTLGVVLNAVSRSQNIFKYHSDAIMSMACSTDGTIIATGQMGTNPTVAVWDSKTCKTLFVLSENDRPKNGVSCVALSRNSELLIFVGMDEQHTISIYDWRNNFLVSRCHGGSKRVLGVCFTDEESNDEAASGDVSFISYGVKELRVWTNARSRFPVCCRAELGDVGVLQTFLTCEMFNGQPNVGTTDGNLYVFESRSSAVLKHAVKAHVGAVNAMHTCRHIDSGMKLLVTGGRDGAVRLWNTDHECIKEFTVDTILSTCHSNRVRSVAFNVDGSRVVVSTRGGEIFEINTQEGKLIANRCAVESHGIRQLSGIAAHPTKEEFVTAGDDKSLRIWNARTYLPVKSLKLDTGSRAVCYSPDGSLIVVGFGSGHRTKGKLSPKEGSFVVLRSGDLKIVHEGKDASAFITVVKYSPDMRVLAIGSDDCYVYLYDVKELYARRVTIKCHSASISSLDFSSNGAYLMTADVSKRVCYSDVSNGILIPSSSSLRDEKWATATTPFVWPVKGFWLSQPAGAEPVTGQKSWGGSLIAAGNSAGNLYVAHFPCPERAGFLKCSGHAGPVSGLAWVAGDTHLLSCGSRDHMVLQWKCVFDNTRESGDEGGRSCADSEVDADGGHQPVLSNRFLSLDAPPSTEKKIPWTSMITAPSNLSPVDETTKLSVNIDLDWVNGIRIGDCRQTLRYNEDGNILYIASTLGIIYNRNDVKQLYYRGHQNTLISIDVNSTGKIAATGELHDNPAIHVWDAKSGVPLCQFTDTHSQGVTSLAFSKDSHYLVSLGQDSMHSIAIFFSPDGNWGHDSYHLCSTSVSSTKMLWCSYVDGNEFPIVVGGAGSIFFFRIVRSINEKLKGVFGKRVKIQPVVCAVSALQPTPLPTPPRPPTGGGERKADGVEIKSRNLDEERELLCGTLSGHIYVFKKYKVINKISAHQGAVNVITATQSQMYITGGKDGLVKVWTLDFRPHYTYRTQYFVPRPFALSVHAVVSNQLGSSLLVGMRGGEVFEISLPSNSHILLIEGHSQYEQHGLDVNPQEKDEYATSGDDGVLRIWSVSRRICLRKIVIDFPSRSLCWSTDGKVMIVGIGGVPATSSKDGSFTAVNATTMEIIKEGRKAKQYITDIKYSNDTAGLVAISSSDGRVYLHESRGLEFLRTIETTSKSSVIRSTDFSSDGQLLRLGTNSDEVFYFSIESNSLVTSASHMKDVQWTNPTVPYSWNFQGVFQKENGAKVLSVAVHPGEEYVAASYSDGDIRVYRHPCQVRQMPFVSVPKVGSQASRIMFTKDGQYLIVLDSLIRCTLLYKFNIF